MKHVHVCKCAYTRKMFIKLVCIYSFPFWLNRTVIKGRKRDGEEEERETIYLCMDDKCKRSKTSFELTN